MKRVFFAIGSFAGLSLAAFAQETPSPVTATATVEADAVVRRLRAEVDELISQAMLAATGKGGTSPTDLKGVKERLDQLQAATPERLADVDREELFKIGGPNAAAFDQAWNKLQGGRARLRLNLLAERQRFLDAIQVALVEAARSADQPADLNRVREAREAYRKLPNIPTVADLFQTRGGDVLDQYLAAMEQVLKVRATGDQKALVQALQSLSFGGNSLYTSPGRLEFHIKPEVTVVFRERLAQEPRGKAEAARKVVEEAIQAQKPHAECEQAISELSKRLEEFRSIRPYKASLPGFEFDEPRELVEAYRRVANFLAWVQGQPKIDTRKLSLPAPVTGSIGMSPEFQTYLAGLSSRYADLVKQGEAAQEKASAERKVAADAWKEVKHYTGPDLKKENDFLYEGLGFSKAFRQESAPFQSQILEVQTPQALLTLSNVAPDFVTKTSKLERGKLPLKKWESLQAEMRRIAAAWSSSSVELTGSESSDFPIYFESTLWTLWSRVRRDLLAQKLNTPELRTAPLADLTLSEGIERLSSAAGEKGDWLRAYEILQSLPVPPESARRHSSNFGMPISDAKSRGLVSHRAVVIKRYLQALNLEQSKQWAEALKAYRDVLQESAEGLPTKEAIQRVQVMRKERPELFK